MPHSSSEDTDKSVRFDLTKVIEQTLSGACSFVVSVARTFFAFLFSRRFASNIRDAAKGRRDTAWHSTQLYARPITYACAMSFLGIASIAAEPRKFTQDRVNLAFAQTYGWMLQGLEKGSVIGVLQAMVPVLAYILLFTVGFCLAAPLFRQRLQFIPSLSTAAYGVGTLFGLVTIEVVLRAGLDALFHSHVRFPFWYLLFHLLDFSFRPFQWLLLVWTSFRFSDLLCKIGVFSWKVGIGIFICGVSFVVFTLLLRGIVSAYL